MTTPDETTAKTFASICDIARGLEVTTDDEVTADWHVAAGLVDIADTLVAVRAELEEIARRSVTDHAAADGAQRGPMNPYEHDSGAAVAQQPATVEEFVAAVGKLRTTPARRSVGANGELLGIRAQLMAEHDRFSDPLLARRTVDSSQPLRDVLTEAEYTASVGLERWLMHNEWALAAINGWQWRMGFGESDLDREPLTMEEPDGSLSLRLK